MHKLFPKHIPLIAFSLYFCKILFLQASWQDLGAILVLSALLFFCEKAKKDENITALNKKIEEYNERLNEQDKKIDENRNYVSSLKMSSTVRSGAGNGGFTGR